LRVVEDAGEDVDVTPFWLLDGPSGRVVVEGGACDRAEAGREGGAAPGFGLPKNPARVVCLELNGIRNRSTDHEDSREELHATV
jgi:hypothetical protein